MDKEVDEGVEEEVREDVDEEVDGTVETLATSPAVLLEGSHDCWAGVQLWQLTFSTCHCNLQSSSSFPS